MALGSMNHLTSGNGEFLPHGKVARREGSHTPLSNAKIKMSDEIPPFPHMPSCWALELL